MKVFLQFADSSMFDLLMACFCLSGILFGWALLANHLLRSRSAAFRFHILRAAFISVAILPLVLTLLPGIPLGFNTQQTARLAAQVSDGPPKTILDSETMPRIAASSEQARSTSGISRALPRINDAVKGEALKKSAGEKDRHDKSGLVVTANASLPINQPAIAERTTSLNSETNWTLTVQGMLVSLWLLGSLVLTVRFVVSFCKVHWIVKNATTNELNGIKVLLTERLSVPVTIGIVKPKVVFPMEAMEWDREKVDLVLAHEIAHIQRKDVFWQSFRYSFETCFGCNLLVGWWSQR